MPGDPHATLREDLGKCRAGGAHTPAEDPRSRPALLPGPGLQPGSGPRAPHHLPLTRRHRRPFESRLHLRRAPPPRHPRRPLARHRVRARRPRLGVRAEARLPARGLLPPPRAGRRGGPALMARLPAPPARAPPPRTPTHAAPPPTSTAADSHPSRPPPPPPPDTLVPRPPPARHPGPLRIPRRRHPQRHPIREHVGRML